MKIKSEEFRVSAGKGVDLEKWPTRVKPVCKSKDAYAKLLRERDFRKDYMKPCLGATSTRLAK